MHTLPLHFLRLAVRLGLFPPADGVAASCPRALCQPPAEPGAASGYRLAMLRPCVSGGNSGVVVIGTREIATLSYSAGLFMAAARFETFVRLRGSRRKTNRPDGPS